MRFPLIAAFSISILFIGGASWLRLSQKQEVEANLATVSNPGSLEIYEGAPSDIYWGDNNTPVPSQELTQTDLISRRLLSDYLNLKSQGELGSGGINTLAESYANSILESKYQPVITSTELTITSDSKVDLLNYTNRLDAFFKKYENMASANLSSSNFDDLNENFESSMAVIAEIYIRAASDFKQIPVPPSLAEFHVVLTNNYLGSAQAFKALSRFNADPLGAYGALAAQSRNSTEEEVTKGKIQEVLGQNEIIWEVSI